MYVHIPSKYSVTLTTIVRKVFSKKMNAANYLSVEKVAQIFGVSARLIYKQINSGSLPHIRIGKRIVVSDTELEKYITRNQHPAKRVDQK